MRIERRNTTEGQSPYAGIDFRLTTSEIRNPTARWYFASKTSRCRNSGRSRLRRAGAEVFSQGRRRARLKKVEEETVPSWLWRSVPDTAALADLPEAERYVSELSPSRCSTPRRLLDLLGLEGRLFLVGRGRARVLRRAALHAGETDGGAEFAANGSTPGCIGPMASMDPARATIMSIPSPAS